MSYSSLDEFIQQEEDKIKRLEQNKNSFFAAFDKLRHHIDICLTTKDYPALFETIGYFKESDGILRLYQTSEIRRILVLLEFLSLEIKNNQTPYVSAATDFQSFMEQYTLTVFALRRLELALDDTSMSEAVCYLTSIPLNVFATLTIIENEYFENYENLFWNLCNLIDMWSMKEKIQLLEYSVQKGPSQRTLLTLASLYLDMNLPDKAYFYLHAIPSPNQEVRDLMNLLKEKLENE